MSDSFQREVIDTLARLETKMGILVGEDGNGGYFRDHEDRLRKLENHKRSIGLSIISAITAALLSLFEWGTHHWRGH